MTPLHLKRQFLLLRYMTKLRFEICTPEPHKSHCFRTTDLEPPFLRHPCPRSIQEQQHLSGDGPSECSMHDAFQATVQSKFLAECFQWKQKIVTTKRTKIIFISVREEHVEDHIIK